MTRRGKILLVICVLWRVGDARADERETTAELAHQLLELERANAREPHPRIRREIERLEAVARDRVREELGRERARPDRETDFREIDARVFGGSVVVREREREVEREERDELEDEIEDALEELERELEEELDDDIEDELEDELEDEEELQEPSDIDGSDPDND